MLFLLIAVALCLLAPWLPVLMYRCLPRRPPPPPAAGDLERLAVELHQSASPEIAEEVLGEDDPVRTDFSQQVEAGPRPAAKKGGERAGNREPSGSTFDGAGGPVSKTEPPPRLTLGSYRWLNLLFVPIFIGTFLALSAGWAVVFHYLGEAHAETFPPAVFLFKPVVYGIIFAVPGIFLGIFTAIPLLVLLAYLLMGRRRFLEYLFWDEGRLNHQGMQPEAILRTLSFLALIVSILSATFIGLAMNWYARLTEDEIAIKRLFALREEVHAYDSVDQIVVTQFQRVGKEIREGADLGLRFRDGRRWSTGQTFMLPRQPVERDRFLEFLCRKTGKPIVRARLLKDVPGW